MKCSNHIKLWQSLFLAAFMYNCKEQYLPPVLKTNKNYLVVEGAIITGDSTIIKLSRTSNISDTALPQAEPGDQVAILGQDGSSYPLADRGDGIYFSAPLNLNTAQQYKLDIHSGSLEYKSDFVPVKLTPPIDSVGWFQDSTNTIKIYVSTHDATNNVGYYRWDYLETWNYHASFKSIFDWVNGQVVEYPLGYVYDCWSFAPASAVQIASTAKLTQNVIYQQPLTTLDFSSEKISVKYSILVKQYALTQDAYNFWQNLKTATQQLGSLFDAQPAQLQSNIHCTTNPSEVVVGYMSASSLQAKRIFISYLDVRSVYVPYYNNYICTSINVPLDSMGYYFPASGPHNWVLQGTVPLSPDYVLFPADCADCRYHGGTNVKPDYWP